MFLDRTQNYAIFEKCQTFYRVIYAGTCFVHTGGKDGRIGENI